MRVLICERISRNGRERLSNAGFEIDIQTGLSQESLLEIIHEYEIIIIGDETILDSTVIEAAENLKLVGKAGTGFENIDLKSCKHKGIEVVHTPGINANAVAELIVGLIVDLVRGITFADKSIRKGNWKFARQMGFELDGRTVAIIGLGPIGRAISDKCNALKMKVIAHTKKDNEKGLFDKLTLVTFEDAVRTADIVVFTIPRTDDTLHVISRDEINMMKDGVTLVNASHRGVIDEVALVEGLKNGKIRAASLDVFEDVKLPKEHPLLSYENVILTPQLGSLTEEAQQRISIEIAEKIIRAVSRIKKNSD